MNTPVSTKDKKDFIKWFLSNYQLKRRESVWILNYLINHDSLLKNVHFITEARFCPRGIIISTHCSEDIPFRFYKNHIVTTDAEKSFHDIRLNRNEPIYIQLNFSNAKQCPDYVAVLEDNPFIPEGYYITKKDKSMAQSLLDASLYQFQRDQLQEKINQALDERNQQEFIKLSEKLSELEVSFQALRTVK
ncbi:ReoY family proteolytic degradation factor [Radiobacillus kanasensis]|uniref:ReoY family proteolytic degradation factor n=1 Tax=Radiobacillus kanasensis TaxID=2844358 RepID=UPI001E448B63|nr:ReoY family proteolytic degradation factor [Radiobacillus kanasensis]UFU01377.1 ReoY family proteolytic degradation factor [Radiobacillus kanasensis]